VISEVLDRWSARAARGLYGIGVYATLPALLALVIVALIWRPYGVFGRRQVRRV